MLSGKFVKVVLLGLSIFCIIVLLAASMNNSLFLNNLRVEDAAKYEEAPAGNELNAYKVLHEGSVREILMEFADKKSITDITDGGVLADALNSQNVDMKAKISAVEANLEKHAGELEDAPDARSFDTARVKVCIAKSIVDDDMKNACELSDPLNAKFGDVDDINALEEILPYFLRGAAYYENGDYSTAKAYLDKVKEHRQAGIVRWNDADFPLNDGTYKKMYDEALRLLAETGKHLGR
jgi:hypothetical protein